MQLLQRGLVRLAAPPADKRPPFQPAAGPARPCQWLRVTLRHPPAPPRVASHPAPSPADLPGHPAAGGGAARRGQAGVPGVRGLPHRDPPHRRGTELALPVLLCMLPLLLCMRALHADTQLLPPGACCGASGCGAVLCCAPGSLGSA